MRLAALALLAAQLACATITLVGNATTEVGSPATSGAITYNGTNGNALIVGCIIGIAAGGTPSHITMSDGVNTYTKGQTQYNGHTLTFVLFQTNHITGGSRAITCSIAGSAGSPTAVFDLYVQEFSGLNNARNAGGQGNSGTGTSITTSAVSTVNNNACVQVYGSDAGGFQSLNAGGGFTQTNSNTFFPVINSGMAYKIVTAASDTCTGSASMGGSANWGISLEAFSDTGSDPTGLRRRDLTISLGH